MVFPYSSLIFFCLSTFTSLQIFPEISVSQYAFFRGLVFSCYFSTSSLTFKVFSNPQEQWIHHESTRVGYQYQRCIKCSIARIRNPLEVQEVTAARPFFFVCYYSRASFRKAAYSGGLIWSLIRHRGGLVS